jgi:alpha-glucosidase
VGQPQARVLAMLVMTLPGTPFVFAGDEIGMERVAVPPERIQDPFEKLVPGYDLNRDPERTPMQWDESHAAGFTTGEPWLPVGAHFEERNVASLQKDSRSILWLYRRLIQLRRADPVITAGDYVPIRSKNGVLLYKRTWAGREMLIALNTMPDPRRVDGQPAGTLVLSTHLDKGDLESDHPLVLRGDEGVIIALSSV